VAADAAADDAVMAPSRAVSAVAALPERALPGASRAVEPSRLGRLT